MSKYSILSLALVLAIMASITLPFSIANAASTVGASSLVIDNTSAAATQVAIDLQPAVTASSGTGYGARMQQTLTASANNDALTAVYINPTFTDGAFTGVVHNGLIVGSGNVGIGTSSPASILHLAADGNIEEIISRSSSDSSVPALTFRKSYGTQASPIGATANEGLGEIKFTEYEGNSYLTAASINVQSETAPTSGAVDGRIRFYTASKTGGNAERMRLTSLGFLGIGTTSPTGRLTLAGNISSPSAWTTAGIQLQGAAATYTDTTSAASATVATRVANSFAQPTFASTNAITVSDAATLYIANAPAAGTNTTITRAHALQIASGDAVFAGNVGIGTTSPTESLDINSNNIRIRTAKTPISAADTCDQGEIAWDSSYIYVCVATNTWKRTGIAAW